jgi:glyoxylase-like metal-dependent hydrolase (beta-lactamase superfamily II)
MLNTLRRGAAALALLVCAPLALAAAPQLKTQVAGWYRTMVGDFELTALSDGHFDLDPSLLKGLKPGELQRQRARQFQSGATIETAVSGYLVNTGSQLILVDTGAAQAFGPTLGRLADNLRASGYRPEQVDLVLLTHLHPDHVAGLLGPDGQPLFANAQVLVGEAESAHWLSADAAAKAPQDVQPFYAAAQAAAKPYAEAGRWKTFKPNADIAPGVRAVADVGKPGHTPGHASFLFSSKGQQLLVLGDLIHVHALQFPRPEVAIAFDLNNAEAIRTRKAVFAKAARQRTLLAGAHLPFPGLGHLRADGAGYAWVPLEFAPIRAEAK